MVKSKTINFVKIPLKNSQTDIKQSFKPAKTLYLELIEDKKKIKQNLVNKDHVQNIVKIPVPKFDDKKIELIPENKDDEIKTLSKDDEIKTLSKDDSDDDFSDEEERELKQKLDKLINNSKDDEVKSKDDEVKSDADDEVKSDADNEIKSDADNEIKSDADNDDNDSIAKRLRDLLDDDDDNETVKDFMKSQDKYKHERNISGQSVQKNSLEPPSLAQLENDGVYDRKKEMPDLSSYAYNQEDDENVKRELLFKFELLKKSYPGSEIPEITVHSSLDSLQKLYDMTLRKLSLDSSVESYKTYLIGCFMATEFVFGNFLNFDMQGFTQQQILSMNSYEKLLIEIGEKSYIPKGGSKWPVEIRLLFLIIMNAAFFIVSKMIMGKTGSNLLGMINGMNSANKNTQNNTKKTKMKGPNINLTEFKN